MKWVSKMNTSTQFERLEWKKYSFFENSPYFIILLDKDWFINEYNPISEDYFGFSKKEATGKKIEEFGLISKDILADFKQNKQKNPAGKLESIETSFVKKDGSEIWLSLSISSIELDRNKFIQITGHEITKRKKTEQNLKQSEQKYHDLFKYMTSGVAVYEAVDNGEDFIFKDLNKGGEKLSKVTKKEVLGKRVSKLFPGVITSGLLKVFKFVWKTGKPKDLPVFRYKDHRIDQYVHNRVYKLPSGDIVAVYENVTEKKEAEIRLKESEQNFRSIINDLDVGYFKFKISGEIIFHNPTFKKFLEIPEDYKIIGKNIKQFWVNPEERKNYLERLKKYGSVKNYQITARKMSGEKIFIQKNSHLIVDENSGQQFIESTFSDVTDQILMEKKLKASEEKFRTVFEQSLIGLSIMKDFKIMNLNKANSYILGYDIEEIKDWELRDFIRIMHPDDSNKVVKKIKKNIQNKNYPLRYQTRIITKSGEIKWVEVFGKFIGKKDENKVLNMVIDITNKKKAERELIRLNRLKSDLLSRTSHELKTPLVAIKGFVNLLLELYNEQLNEEMRTIVNDIQKGANRLENLIKDILKTSELDSDEVILKKQKVNLKKLIRETIMDLKILIETREHTIDDRFVDNLIIILDKNKIKEVIDNLMSNAIKYTPKGGRIVINSEQKKDKILISISDNGIGLTKRDKENLFKQFGKIEKYGKGWDIDTEGTGLGLYISKQIIELHGGNIWATSSGVNQGSTFFFTLPKN